MGRPLWRPPPGNTDSNASDDANKQAALPPCVSPSTYHTSSSSSSSSSSGSSTATTSAPAEPMVMRNDSSMLTLDEFLRETSTRDSTERQLQGLLALRRRIGSETSGRPGRWGSLYEHTPAGRRRILAGIPPPPVLPPQISGRPRAAEGDEEEGSGGEEAEGDEDRIPGIYWNFRARVPPPQLPAALRGPSPAQDPMAALAGTSQPARASVEARQFLPSASPIAWPPLPPPSSLSSAALPSLSRQDSFDTLVSQIRRIGALQDFMLSSTSFSPTDPPTATTAGTAATVASLRVREARLRAMQTRIDLLASEFAVLSSTRREMRRAMASSGSASGSGGGSVSGGSGGGGEASAVPAAPSQTEPEQQQQQQPQGRMSESLRDELMRSAVMRMQIEALPI